MTPFYRICAFGNTAGFTDEIRNALSSSLSDFGLGLDAEVELIVGSESRRLDPTVSSMGLFFGGDPVPRYERPTELGHYDPVIPIVSGISSVGLELPIEVSGYNAMACTEGGAPDKIAGAVLECLGIVPSRRRVFLSYRRCESQHIALQLFDELSREQFEVFLDTHEIRPGAVFQDILHHHLSDCDVLVMLDTATYFESRWTTEEFASATTKKAAIFRVGFPRVARTDAIQVTDELSLDSHHFASDGKLSDATLANISDSLERLRSKSVATRQAILLGSFRAALLAANGTMTEPGRYRRTIASFPCGRNLVVYPAVGVPTSEQLNRIVDDSGEDECAVLYDRVGVLETWQTHLDWLGARVDSFRWIKADEAATSISEFLT